MAQASCAYWASRNVNNTAESRANDVDSLNRNLRRYGYRRAHASEQDRTLTLSGVPSCAPRVLHNILNRSGSNDDPWVSFMCSTTGWEVIVCNGADGASRRVVLEESCDCMQEEPRPGGRMGFRCSCDL
jgi:hypothetical protein